MVELQKGQSVQERERILGLRLTELEAEIGKKDITIALLTERVSYIEVRLGIQTKPRKGKYERNR